MEETTFGVHVNNTAERISHRANRRLSLLLEVDVLQASTFTKYCQRNRRDLSKTRKIR